MLSIAYFTLIVKLGYICYIYRVKNHSKRKGQKHPHNPSRKIEGQISISSKGTGYVKTASPSTSKQDDIEIDAKHLNTSLHGDTVEILLHPKGRDRQTGEVSKIISRAKIGFAGVLEKENSVFFLKPDDAKMYTDILIPESALAGAKAGDKVFGEIVSWRDPRKAPEGRIIKVLGRPGDNNAEMHAIAIEKGFDSELSPLAIAEAQKIKLAGIKEVDYAGRRDFRKILTFTIDPSDAKDFDDAISFRELAKNEYEIGIHIADVSYYVRAGSVLDHEAGARGTSVYLVDRTIPMLPEVLSNDLCSLVPHKDRLTMSAVFTIDKDARVRSEWYGRTVIHSQKRFTYEEAEEAIKKSGGTLHPELAIINGLAKKLNKERFANGALLLEQEEIKFVLDDKGVPIKVVPKERRDSNKLIEEFMLLANKKVAEVFSRLEKKKEGVFVYRVHDEPSREKMEDLAFFLKSLNFKVSLVNGNIPTHQLNSIIEKLSAGASVLKDAVERVVIRSMAKAIYSTKNIGHYGLAFKDYTHFTSPIRRYPDVIVHRLLMEHLNGLKVRREKLPEKAKIYESLMRTASDQEKRAADAERASIKYKQVEYMSSRIGKKFEGVISGITEWGMYVEEVETRCEV